MRARAVGVAVAGLVGAALGVGALVRAQPPAVPGAPPLPGGPTPPAGAVAAAPGGAAATGAAPRNIWSFFMKTPEQKAQFRAHFCRSRAGMFVNNLLVPVGAATGGLLGPVCPPPGQGLGPGGSNPEDLKKPAGSPEGAAAKIKAEEAGAKAKVAAIEYLATVDCRYYPEAEAGLIAGLRAEKNECVRIAAAKALASGCCCSAKVLKALLMTVNCSNKDGFPAEASEVVRAYAFVALERCLRKCVEAEPEAPPEPPAPVKKAVYDALTANAPDYQTTVMLAAYYAPDERASPNLYADARQAVGRGLVLSPQAVARLSGPKNLMDGAFPRESRPALSLAPSLPSFASARRSAVPQPVAVVPAPAPDAPVAVPARADTFAFPTPMPAYPDPVEPRAGRGNLANIFQDARRR